MRPKRSPCAVALAAGGAAAAAAWNVTSARSGQKGPLRPVLSMVEGGGGRKVDGEEEGQRSLVGRGGGVSSNWPG